MTGENEQKADEKHAQGLTRREAMLQLLRLLVLILVLRHYCPP